MLFFVFVLLTSPRRQGHRNSERQLLGAICVIYNGKDDRKLRTILFLKRHRNDLSEIDLIF